MTARLDAVCIDANVPQRLARFWAAALRWDIVERGGQLGLSPTDGTPFRIRFEPGAPPKAGKNRIHLDLTTTSTRDQRESAARLIELGGSPADVGQRGDEGHVVLADPEGNELCLIEPGNAFLAGCGRLGSVTCDGSPAVGHFWSDALGWPLVWDRDDETAIRAPGGDGPFITWGPPVRPKTAKNRLHFDIVPSDGDQVTEARRLTALGATRLDMGQGDLDWVVMADPDGNEFCVLNRR